MPPHAHRAIRALVVLALAASASAGCRRPDRGTPAVVPDEAAAAEPKLHEADCPSSCSSGFCWDGHAEHRIALDRLGNAAFAGEWLVWTDFAGVHARSVRSGERRELGTKYAKQLAAGGSGIAWLDGDGLHHADSVTSSPRLVTKTYCADPLRARLLRVVSQDEPDGRVLAVCDEVAAHASGVITDITHLVDVFASSGPPRRVGELHRDPRYAPVLAGFVVDGGSVVVNAGHSLQRRRIAALNEEVTVVHDFGSGFVSNVVRAGSYWVAEHHGHSLEESCAGGEHRLYAVSGAGGSDAASDAGGQRIDLGRLSGRPNHHGLAATSSHVLAAVRDTVLHARLPSSLQRLALKPPAVGDAGVSSAVDDIQPVLSPCGTVALVAGTTVVVRGVDNW